MQYNHRFIIGNLIILLTSCQFHWSQCAPHDIESKLCPGKTTFTRKNRTFSSLGQRCSVENDAYLLGAMYGNYSTIGKKFDTTSIQKRWSSMVYLDASEFDQLGNPTPPPATAPSCVFNERLAKQLTNLDVIVALSCNPFELTYCRTEYDDSLSLIDYCDCNYLYSVKENTSSGEIKCLAKAGVPCKFKQTKENIDPFLKLPESIQCHSSLVCNDTNKKKQSKVFEGSFHGFGLNPIVYEYMMENVEGYCDCKSPKLKISPLNECVDSKGVRWTFQIVKNLCLFMILYFGFIYNCALHFFAINTTLV